MYSWMRQRMAALRAWLREQAALVTEAQPLGLGALLRTQELLEQVHRPTPEQLQALAPLLVTVKAQLSKPARRPSQSRKSTKSKRKTGRSMSKPHR